MGTLQTFGLLVWAQSYIQLIIPRFSGSPFGLGGRGVSFLAQEPSGAGFIVTLMLATGAYFYMINKISGKVFSMITIAVLTMLFMNKSGTTFLLLFIFFSVLLFMLFWYSSLAKKIKAFFMTMPIVPIFVIVTIITLNYYTDTVKFVALLNKLINLVESESIFSYGGIASLSGGRFITVAMGYASLYYGFGMGHGIASYQDMYSKLSTLLNLNWYRYSISQRFASGEEQKPNAYGAIITLDMGVIGLGLLILIVYHCWRSRDKVKYWGQETILRKSLLVSIFSTAIFIIFFRSTTTMPVAWVMLAYVHDFIRREIKAAEVKNSISQRR
ncbi:MAG: hypothetical protein HY752_00295 [Nitrospirae bacterium]|nr:hypothetical protein [Nitrospirota bacterium]